MAREGLISLASQADRPSLVEYGIAADADDPATAAWARRHGFFVVVYPRRLGWAGHGAYMAGLWEASAGEWVLCWGDDGRMATPGWDEQVRRADPGVLWLGGHPREHNVFPAVHRAVLEAIGEHLPSPHIDTWLTEVATEAGCLQPTDIRIWEDRFDLTGNNLDDVWREGSVNAYRGEEYASPPMKILRGEHAARVAAALAA